MDSGSKNDKEVREMGSAISIGQTGLAASAKQMEVIGNNLANSNTVGFKASSTLFANMMNQGLSSAGYLAAGQGVEVTGMPTQFVQGSFENTGSVTDMAIDGEGFFIVKDSTGIPLYTRAGSFHIDNQGNLVDGKGYKVQGYSVVSGALSTVPGDIVLLKSKNATATTKVSFGANLNENTDENGEFNVSQSVYDSKGGAHTLTLIFTKTATAGEWDYTATFDGIDTGLAETLQFEADGTLIPTADVAIAIDDADSDIAAVLNGATIGDASGEITWTVFSDTREKLTGYASTSVIRSINSDGYASGDLRSLDIDNDGTIYGVYTNGEVVEMARVSLAYFQDQSALKKNGNYFGETTGSGKATVNAAGTGGLGEVQSNSLEVSNTDVAKEFINMITAQRAYQASAKIITVADAMLTELMNIKR
jgi:flagellar hook protein FlgE